MPCAVEMYFDAASSDRLISVWQEIAADKVSSTLLDNKAEPHVSLAVLDQVDLKSMETSLRLLTENLAPFEIRFSSVGTFPGNEGVVFLLPVMTDQLKALHHRFHELLGNNRSIDYYLPNRWTPHCSMSLDTPMDRIPAAIEICRRYDFSAPTFVERVGLIEYRPVKTLLSFSLR